MFYFRILVLGISFHVSFAQYGGGFENYFGYGNNAYGPDYGGYGGCNTCTGDCGVGYDYAIDPFTFCHLSPCQCVATNPSSSSSTAPLPKTSTSVSTTAKTAAPGGNRFPDYFGGCNFCFGDCGIGFEYAVNPITFCHANPCQCVAKTGQPGGINPVGMTSTASTTDTTTTTTTTTLAAATTTTTTPPVQTTQSAFPWDFNGFNPFDPNGVIPLDPNGLDPNGLPNFPFPLQPNPDVTTAPIPPGGTESVTTPPLGNELFITEEDGRSYLEGDIEVPESDKPVMYETYGIELPHGMRAATDNRRRYWNYKNGKYYEIPYTIKSNVNSNMRKLINQAISVLQSKTCVKFVPRRKHANYVYIESGSGCSSMVGMQGKGQRISLRNSGCARVGIILHEFMHALGFYHEQSRPDRDKYIKILWDNIKDKKKYINFRKRSTAMVSGTRYDYGSVMHYGLTSFAKPGKKTLQVRVGNPKNVGQRTGLSSLDIYEINKLYPCGSKPRCKDDVTLWNLCGLIKKRNLCSRFKNSCKWTCDAC